MKPPPEELIRAAEQLERADGVASATSAWLRDCAATEGAPKKPRRPRPDVLARYQQLDALWAEGRSVYEIGALLGKEPNIVTSMVHQARTRFGLCPSRSAKTVALPPRGTEFPAVSLPIGLRIFGRYRQHFFHAIIIDSGISVHDVGTFATLSKAAQIAVLSRTGSKRLINGWDFWRVRLTTGQECFTSNLRISPELMDQVQDVHPIAPYSPVRIGHEAPIPWVQCAARVNLAADDLTSLRVQLEMCGVARLDVEGQAVVVRRCETR